MKVQREANGRKPKRTPPSLSLLLAPVAVVESILSVDFLLSRSLSSISLSYGTAEWASSFSGVMYSYSTKVWSSFNRPSIPSHKEMKRR